ncbi:MAG: vitamin K epoxide reductase family protein [Candidatus Woesearchaeota archaeon]|nr:vitamin K epoxide reductase family protein [Candidatus Woesearchaeota archaeon]
MLTLQILAFLGFLVSLYAYTVERNARNPDYKAFCDFKDSMSCTKAFTSPYGKLFGVSNALGGLVFYAVIFLLTFFGQTTFIFILSLVSFWGTLYLAYLSYFKMKNFCVVCHIIYLINVLLFIFAIRVLLAA